MKKSMNPAVTLTVALAQIFLLSACGRFSPAEVAAATAKLETKAEPKTDAATPATTAAKETTHKEVVTCKMVSTTVFTPTGGEAQTTNSTSETKANRTVTKSADGKTTSVESIGEFVITGGFHLEGDQKVQNVQKGTSAASYKSVRTENEDGTTTEVMDSKVKRTAAEGSYIATAAGNLPETESTTKSTSVFKVVGNETRGISTQRNDSPAEADASVTVETEKDGVKTSVTKVPPTTFKGEDGDTTDSSEETCVTELVK